LLAVRVFVQLASARERSCSKILFIVAASSPGEFLNRNHMNRKSRWKNGFPVSILGKENINLSSCSFGNSEKCAATTSLLGQLVS